MRIRRDRFNAVMLPLIIVVETVIALSDRSTLSIVCLAICGFLNALVIGVAKWVGDPDDECD